LYNANKDIILLLFVLFSIKFILKSPQIIKLLWFCNKLFSSSSNLLKKVSKLPEGDLYIDKIHSFTDQLCSLNALFWRAEILAVFATILYERRG
jgi:hypothetical protein